MGEALPTRTSKIIQLCICAQVSVLGRERCVKGKFLLSTQHSALTAQLAALGPGVSSGVAPPVPIPNTAVKRPSVDDTGGVALWENRPMPGPSLIQKSPDSPSRLFLFALPTYTFALLFSPSFPRKRESRNWTETQGWGSPALWIPAFAGMTEEQ